MTKIAKFRLSKSFYINWLDFSDNDFLVLKRILVQVFAVNIFCYLQFLHPSILQKWVQFCNPPFQNSSNFLQTWSRLTPNRPVIHTYFTYPILNMGDFSALYGPLGCIDSTQKVKGNSLHAEQGIWKGKGSGIIHI